jgi:hypothetical protein
MRMKALRLCLFSAFSISLAAYVPSIGSAAAGITVDQIISKNLLARGGSATWKQINTMTMSGQMDVGKGMKVPYVLEMKRGRKVRLEIQFQGQTAVQVYDGLNGWKKRPFLGRQDVEAFTPEELQKASMDSDLDGPLVDYAAKGTQVSLEGTDTIDGHDAYRLKLTLKGGNVRHLWIDEQSFLEAKIDGTRRMDGKQRRIDTYYRDYRTVHGITVPFLFETALENVKDTEKIRVETVAVNPSLDDALFAKLR